MSFLYNSYLIYLLNYVYTVQECKPLEIITCSEVSFEVITSSEFIFEIITFEIVT